jgi:hypothetical protein
MQTTAPGAPPGFSTAAGPEEALALFDRLPAVEPTELLGRWLGGSFSTGHPLNGVLERWTWLGTVAAGNLFQRLALPL